jgi:hypothetical protein
MRKTSTVTISREGRDQGKVFLLTEMPASQAEKWAARAFFALARSGVDVPEDIAEAGFAGIAVLGLKALGGIHFVDAEPLMDEMFACIRILPSAARPDIVRDIHEQDIEEVATRLQLRMEVFNLHTGFLPAGTAFTSISAPAAAVS